MDLATRVFLLVLDLGALAPFAWPLAAGLSCVPPVLLFRMLARRLRERRPFMRSTSGLGPHVAWVEGHLTSSERVPALGDGAPTLLSTVTLAQGTQRVTLVRRAAPSLSLALEDAALPLEGELDVRGTARREWRSVGSLGPALRDEIGAVVPGLAPETLVEVTSIGPGARVRVVGAVAIRSSGDVSGYREPAASLLLRGSIDAPIVVEEVREASPAIERRVGAVAMIAGALVAAVVARGAAAIDAPLAGTWTPGLADVLGAASWRRLDALDRTIAAIDASPATAGSIAIGRRVARETGGCDGEARFLFAHGLTAEVARIGGAPDCGVPELVIAALRVEGRASEAAAVVRSEPVRRGATELAALVLAEAGAFAEAAVLLEGRDGGALRRVEPADGSAPRWDVLSASQSTVVEPTAFELALGAVPECDASCRLALAEPRRGYVGNAPLRAGAARALASGDVDWATRFVERMVPAEESTALFRLALDVRAGIACEDPRFVRLADYRDDRDGAHALHALCEHLRGDPDALASVLDAGHAGGRWPALRVLAANEGPLDAAALHDGLRGTSGEPPIAVVAPRAPTRREAEAVRLRHRPIDLHVPLARLERDATVECSTARALGDETWAADCEARLVRLRATLDAPHAVVAQDVSDWLLDGGPSPAAPDAGH